MKEFEIKKTPTIRYQYNDNEEWQVLGIMSNGDLLESIENHKLSALEVLTFLAHNGIINLEIIEESEK